MKRWQDLRVALQSLPRALKLVWEAHRLCTIGMAVLTLIAAALPAAQAWAGKLIVDTVVHALNRHTPVEAGLRAALPFLLLEFGLIVTSAVLSQGQRLIEHIVHARVDYTVSSEIIRKALALDLQAFEDATFYDQLQNARREGGDRALQSINTGFTLIQNSLTLASFAVILLAFSPLVATILVVATLPAFIAQTRTSKLYFRLLTWRAPEARRMQYLEHLLTVDSSVKEVKLFGLGEPLLQRYQNLFWTFYREDTALALRRSRNSILWGLVSSGSYYAAYAYIVWRTLSGSITLGDMTLYLALCRQSQGTFQSLLGAVGDLYEGGLFLNNLFDFLGLQPRMLPAPNARRVPRPITTGFEFQGVSFRYPGR
ncbi:MAG TPA: ABC transporter ATP-binding protein, partial [Herpetosiphonaceae bacterium]|nr:ABC transporter ATP-binding protein [Herpetosiphonaceae bacterium]